MRFHVLVAQFGLACAVFAQAPRELTLDERPERALTLDERIEALPPIGCHHHRDPDSGKWFDDPIAAGMQPYVEAHTLSDDQWRRALVNSGSFRYRSRWVAGEPWLVSLSVPFWIRRSTVTVAPIAPGLDELSDTNSIAGCGMSDLTEYATFWGPFRGESLGPVDALGGSSRCSIRIERSGFTDLRLPQRERELWSGPLDVDMTLAASVDEILTPRSGPELDDRVRRGLSLSIVERDQPDPDDEDALRAALAAKLELRVDERTSPELLDVAIAFELELLRDGEAVGDSWAVPMALADLPHAPHPNAPPPRGFVVGQFVAALPLDTSRDPAQYGHWSVRVRGDGIGALALWDSKAYWKGELTLPLADALAAYERERSRR